MRFIPLFLSMTMAYPAIATEAVKPPAAEEKEIVVTGVADGTRVVEVDFDKVWKGCAECKRALAKLDRLSQNYRDELEMARLFASGPSTNHCNGAAPSALTTFQHSSAESTDQQPRTTQSLVDGLCAARLHDSAKRNFTAMAEQHVRPEQGKMLAYMRAFLDQLAPHLRQATEAERIANGASLGLTDAKRTRLSAKNLTRIDVTQAVIRRLDATDFTIVLPDPPPRGAAGK